MPRTRHSTPSTPERNSLSSDSDAASLNRELKHVAHHPKRIGRRFRREDLCPVDAKAELRRICLGQCMFCRKTSTLRLVRIVSQNADAEYESQWIRELGDSVSFGRDSRSNFLLLCHGHRRRFRGQAFALIPAEEDLEMLISFEEENFKERETRWQLRKDSTIPQRALPATSVLSGWIEILLLRPTDDDYMGLLEYIVDLPYQIPRVAQMSAATHRPKSTFRWRRKSASEVFEFHMGETVLNPWALVVNCLRALGSGLFPNSTRVVAVQRRLIRLRELYNRSLFPISGRVSG